MTTPPTAPITVTSRIVKAIDAIGPYGRVVVGDLLNGGRHDEVRPTCFLIERLRARCGPPRVLPSSGSVSRVCNVAPSSSIPAARIMIAYHQGSGKSRFAESIHRVSFEGTFVTIVVTQTLQDRTRRRGDAEEGPQSGSPPCVRHAPAGSVLRPPEKVSRS